MGSGKQVFGVLGGGSYTKCGTKASGKCLQTPVRGNAKTTYDGRLVHTRFVRGGRRRARRGRARFDFCKAKSKPSAPEHCGREFSGRRNYAVTAERRPLKFKGVSANQLALLAEAAKGARGKAKGFSPNGAPRVLGVRSGALGPRRKTLHFTICRPSAGFAFCRPLC